MERKGLWYWAQVRYRVVNTLSIACQNLWHKVKPVLQKHKCLKASGDHKQHKCWTGVMEVLSVIRVLCIIWELVKTALLWLWKIDVLHFVNTLFIGRLTPSGVSFCQATVNAWNEMGKGHVRLEHSLVCPCRQLSLCMQVTGQLEDCLTSLLGYVALFQNTSWLLLSWWILWLSGPKPLFIFRSSFQCQCV